jgi:hypothetical protein
MYCTTIFDLDEDKVVRFFWVSTCRRAYRLQQRYIKLIDAARYETAIEGMQSSYNLDNACGY